MILLLDKIIRFLCLVESVIVVQHVLRSKCQWRWMLQFYIEKKENKSKKMKRKSYLALFFFFVIIFHSFHDWPPDQQQHSYASLLPSLFWASEDIACCRWWCHGGSESSSYCSLKVLGMHCFTFLNGVQVFCKLTFWFLPSTFHFPSSNLDFSQVYSTQKFCNFSFEKSLLLSI